MGARVLTTPTFHYSIIPFLFLVDLMYTQFFGLERKPFDITPDPRFLYTSAQYKEVLATLLYGVKEKKGLIVLTGEVGTGKTLLVRSLLQILDSDSRTAFVFNPRLELGDFFGMVGREFELDGDLSTKGKFLDRLNAFLLDTAAKKKRAVLIVDEAQNLSLPVLEEIRLLMNLETANEKLLQVILSGQPELHRIINFNCMRQFKQRISLRCHLGPLSKRETGDYIARRLQVAGYHGEPVFTQRAIRRIRSHSGGIPRIINVICDNALLTGYATNQRRIDHRVIEEAIEDLERIKTLPRKTEAWPRDEADLAKEWTGRLRSKKPRFRWIAGALGIALAALAGILIFSDLPARTLMDGLLGLVGR